MTKHPHAELMKLYAEDAMNTARPWELWEFRKEGGDHWMRCTKNPDWVEYHEYKQRPKTVVVDDIEFPEPYIPFELICSERVFYTIGISGKGLIVEEIKRHRANFEKFDDLLMRGLIFKQSDDCERYIKALSNLNDKIIEYFNQ